MVHPYFDAPRPHILGHRGAAGEAPENTLLAFARGLELGASMIESDVHATRDGIPVLIHDPDVARITDGTGNVADLSLEELSRLDAGYRFGHGTSHEDAHGPPFPQRGRGLRIPSLRGAFEAFPQARFNLEIKAETPGLVDAVIALVMEFDRESSTLLAAGDDRVMAHLRERCTAAGCQVAIGACLGEILAVVQSAVAGEPPPPEVEVLQIPADFANRPLVTADLVAHAHAHGIGIHVWTINEPEEIAHLLALGVDGIVSDFPQRVVTAARR